VNQEDRFKLYERLYFYESERREKISARLSITFAAILATVGFLSFMLNADTHPRWCVAQMLFWLLFIASACALLVGAWFFRRAWYGNTDQHLPPADKIEAYHAELVTLYRDEPNADELVQKYFSSFMFDYYIKTSSIITANNDGRTYSIYRANLSLTIAVLLSFLAAIPFYVGRIVN